MPILSHEPELYPADLLDRVDLVNEAEGGPQNAEAWWVVHTKPRQEKTLARQLAALQIAHYVPQYEVRTRAPSGRKRTSFAPLFAGYGFAYGSADDRARMFSSTAVARLLEVHDQGQLTFDLRQIRLLTQSGRVLQPESRLQPGAAVRITAGPFQNFDGRIVQRRSGNRLLVIVNYLQQGVSVEIEDDEIELV